MNDIFPVPVTTSTFANFGNLSDAEKHFESRFYLLTGNSWSSRANFVKLPDYYDLIKAGVWQDERLLTSGDRIESQNLAWSKEITQGVGSLKLRLHSDFDSMGDGVGSRTHRLI